METNNLHKEEIKQLEALFARQGIKASSDRLKILEVFLGTEEHVTERELVALLKKRGLHFDAGFVQETITLFAQYGVANKVSFEGEEPRYEHWHIGQHHDHLICIKCQKIIEFTDEQVEEIQRHIAFEHQFYMLRHRMEIYGLCSGCVTAREPEMPLASARRGEVVQVERFSGGKELTKRVKEMGLRIGDEVEIITNDNRGPIVIALHCSRLVVGRMAAQKIWVAQINRQINESPQIKLSDLKQGQKATIMHVAGSGAFRKRLMELGFLKGTEVVVEKYAPLRDPVELVIKGYHISLRVCEADHVFVVNVQDGSY
ncbi:MAG: FeoA domain-containing protein [Pseudomonadota bacterium]